MEAADVMASFLQQLRSGNLKDDEKANIVAEVFRIKCNEHRDRGELYEALVACNTSIYCAVPNTKALSVAYANRSKIYFKCEFYMECLDNIKLARENGYPADKLHKLQAREDKWRIILPLDFAELEEFKYSCDIFPYKSQQIR